MAKYWIRLRDKVSGPVTGAQLKQYARAGRLTQNHEITHDQKHWTSASKVKGLEFRDGKSESQKDIDKKDRTVPSASESVAFTLSVYVDKNFKRDFEIPRSILDLLVRCGVVMPDWRILPYGETKRISIHSAYPEYHHARPAVQISQFWFGDHLADRKTMIPPLLGAVAVSIVLFVGLLLHLYSINKFRGFSIVDFVAIAAPGASLIVALFVIRFSLMDVYQYQMLGEEAFLDYRDFGKQLRRRIASHMAFRFFGIWIACIFVGGFFGFGFAGADDPTLGFAKGIGIGILAGLISAVGICWKKLTEGIAESEACASIGHEDHAAKIKQHGNSTLPRVYRGADNSSGEIDSGKTYAGGPTARVAVRRFFIAFTIGTVMSSAAWGGAAISAAGPANKRDKVVEKQQSLQEQIEVLDIAASFDAALDTGDYKTAHKLAELFASRFQNRFPLQSDQIAQGLDRISRDLAVAEKLLDNLSVALQKGDVQKSRQLQQEFARDYSQKFPWLADEAARLLRSLNQE